MNQKIEKLKSDILHELGEIEKVLKNIDNLNHEIYRSGVIQTAKLLWQVI